MNAKQLARIKKMEDDFNHVSEVVKSLDECLSDYETIQPQIKCLTDYQESGQWLEDFEADERGELPDSLELRRGVLSEDGLYNLLSSVSDVYSRMQAMLEKQHLLV